jgi:Ni/Co efflux regulator RcnB
MTRVVSTLVAAAFAAVSLAAVANDKPAADKQKAEAAAQRPATAEKTKQGAAPVTKTEPKADAKPATTK